jgi:hypothetical protein
MESISRQCVERMARIYANNQDASRALGPAFASFVQLCRRYGIRFPGAGRRCLPQIP